MNIVVDACVIGNASGNSSDAIALKCWDALRFIYDICHHYVRYPVLLDEYARHQSMMSLRWRSDMERKGKHHDADLTTHGIIIPPSLPGYEEGAMAQIQKDSHLIQAALATDKVILSCDDRARNLFSLLSDSVYDIRPIVWINPTAISPGKLKHMLNSMSDLQEHSLESWRVKIHCKPTH